MTTKHSPLRVIRAQAEGIAKVLKMAERGEYIATDPMGKIKASLAKGENFEFAIVMDDKTLRVSMPWAQIKSSSETAISAWIIKHMREQREH